MEKAKIGAILKARIKQQGFTQQEFADEVGVDVSTLKNYLSGKNAYDYEMLDRIAEKLECSYDYLLGLSKSPIKEHHEIAEQTRLSEEAIRKITQYASRYDVNFEAKRYIMCLDRMISEDGLFMSICDYLVASKNVHKMEQRVTEILQKSLWYILKMQNLYDGDDELGKEIIQRDRIVSLETQAMIEFVVRMKEMKNGLTPEFVAEIKELDKETEFSKKIEEFEKIISMLMPNI